MNISKLALISLSIISPICAMQISNESLMVPQNLGKVKLYREDHGFTLKQNKELHSIANHDIDPLLHKANPEQLKEFLKKAGYIKIHQANNGEFSLSSCTRGNGGGQFLGKVFRITVSVGGRVGVAALCWWHPESIAEAQHMLEIVEAASQTAEVVGTSLPWY